VSLPPGAIPLRCVRFVRRRPYLLVQGDELVIQSPRHFTTPWHVPVAQVAMLDERQLPHWTTHPGELVRSIALPDLTTASELHRSNLTLLFAEPMRVPPLRKAWWMNSAGPVSYSASRSPEGAFVDGARFHAVDPEAARLTLAAGGIATAGDGSTWARSRAEDLVIRDPELAAEVTAGRRRANWGIGVAVVLMVLGMVLATLGPLFDDGPEPVGITGMATGVVGLGIGVWAARRMSAADKRAKDESAAPRSRRGERA
jgi:hypothetical protein